MHHGTCVTHVPWCMSGSLTCGYGENVPGIPGTCAPAICVSGKRPMTVMWKTSSKAQQNTFVLFEFIYTFNTLRPRQNGRHFADDTFKCIFLNENVITSTKISLKFVPKCSINNIPTLVEIMAWRRPGDKPLSRPMIIRLPTHICVTRPQWVNSHVTL